MEMFRQFINQKSETVIFSLRIDNLGVLRNTIHHQQLCATAIGGVKLLVHRQIEQFRQVVRDHDLWICFMSRHLVLRIVFSAALVCLNVFRKLESLPMFVERRHGVVFCVPNGWPGKCAGQQRTAS
jgi:hypothetical protein